MSKISKTDLMREIKDELIVLSGSPLYEYRVENNYFPVIGEGNHNANIVFIGEAPGKNEALTGKPFCGASGRILDELLAHISLSRESVYVTNVVKDRPHENRDPRPEEIETYAPYLDRQLSIIEPKVIATLGRFSMDYIMKKFGLEYDLEPISQIHGKIFKTDASFGKVSVVPLYHPAVAVYNANKKGLLKEDFEVLKQFI